jgi:hypothetical protein
MNKPANPFALNLSDPAFAHLKNPTLAAPAPKPKRKATKWERRFTMFPAAWEELLGKAHASGSTYAVAIVLLYEARLLTGRGYSPTVKLTNVMLKRVSVGRKGKKAALAKLGGLGLVSVEDRGRRNPIVTVHFFE